MCFERDASPPLDVFSIGWGQPCVNPLVPLSKMPQVDQYPTDQPQLQVPEPTGWYA